MTFEKWDEFNENTVISNNNSEGLQSSNNVQILFDSDLGIQFEGNNGSINLGENTYMSVEGNITTDEEISCWIFILKIQTTLIIQQSNKPIIEFNYTTGLPQINSNCRIITPKIKTYFFNPMNLYLKS